VNTPDYGHLVGWWDQNSPANQSNRLYRIFEFLEAGPRASGMNTGGRIAGKVNLNTIYDIETFRALCDQQSSNFFTAADVDAAYNQMVSLRTPGLGGMPATLGANDQPFYSMAIGNSPGGDPLFTNASGIGNTFLRPFNSGGAPNTPRLFQAQSIITANPLPPPYVQNELMTKIYNNVTTRSNVFAVWLTVGFFKVIQDTDAAGNPVRPVKLGAEMGVQFRHRMFAIVDRTNLHLALGNNASGQKMSLTKTTAPIQAANPAFMGGPTFPVTVTVTPQAMSGTTDNGINWSIQPGTVLVVDNSLNSNQSYLSPNQKSNEELVVVTSVGPTGVNPPTQFTANFMKAHGSGANITILGNPGPQPQFYVGNGAYNSIVPWFNIIN
jgi:hypothetical protein